MASIDNTSTVTAAATAASGRDWTVEVTDLPKLIPEGKRGRVYVRFARLEDEAAVIAHLADNSIVKMAGKDSGDFITWHYKRMIQESETASTHIFLMLLALEDEPELPVSMWAVTAPFPNQMYWYALRTNAKVRRCGLARKLFQVALQYVVEQYGSDVLSRYSVTNSNDSMLLWTERLGIGQPIQQEVGVCVF
jgi:hypothetical protein